MKYLFMFNMALSISFKVLQKKGHEIALRPKEFLENYDIKVEFKKEVI